uniref:Uncharacterized protein n=1 Tax=Rhizophora mucronata TaxID=61149 RepID=A0A2P2PND8_RHIMU
MGSITKVPQDNLLWL